MAETRSAGPLRVSAQVGVGALGQDAALHVDALRMLGSHPYPPRGDGRTVPRLGAYRSTSFFCGFGVGAYTFAPRDEIASI